MAMARALPPSSAVANSPLQSLHRQIVGQRFSSHSTRMERMIGFGRLSRTATRSRNSHSHSLGWPTGRRSSGKLLSALVIGLLLTPAVFAQDDPAAGGSEAAGRAESPAEVAEDGDQAEDSSTSRILISFGLLGIVQAMGYEFVVPFVIASVIAMWFSIERLVVLRRGRVLPRPFIQRFLQHLEQGQVDRESALELCEENGSPVASVFAHGIRKWGKPSVEVEQAIIDGGERQVSQLRKHLRVVNGVATVTPLIGLLGTVIGMITAFNEIANTGPLGKAQELAVGISLALLTTAAGLMIAIPSLIMYMYLAGRVDALVMEMDHLAQNVVHLISAEGLAAREVPVARGSS
jgi:biopolymer transport protein ExbB